MCLYVRMQTNLKNTGNIWNIGANNPPPNMSSTTPEMMSSALPGYSQLRVDRSGVERATAECRSYEGIDGLRRLQVNQANKTYYDPKCGWLYNGADSSHKGFFGTYDGTPADARVDQISGANSFMKMDLKEAELQASSNIISKAGTGCDKLGTIRSQDRNSFGYCKSTNSIIPIISSNGAPYPRYPDIPNWSCASSDIVTASGTCPSGSGFRNYAAEGFDDGGNLLEQQQCSIPLTRDCVIQAVKSAGCTDRGAILDALSDSKKTPALQTNSAYSYYLNKTNMPAYLVPTGGGIQSIQQAYDTFYALSDSAKDTTKSVGIAARDLCLESGFFKDKYDICSEVRDSDIISQNNIDCVQKLWGLAGGTTKGKGYPTTAPNSWGGKTVGAFKQHLKSLVSEPFTGSIHNPDRTIQAAAVRELIGVDTRYIATPRNLEKDVQNNKGAETIWFLNSPKNPIVLRADCIMGVDASLIETVPSILNPDDFGKLRLDPLLSNIAFTSAFEYRPATNTQVSFRIDMNGGTMIGYNQNPFEQKNNKDWGSWRDNTANTVYETGAYDINSADSNIFVIKHFGSSKGLDRFGISVKTAGDSTFRKMDPTNMYLTQEALAPWLQYEVCTRKNDGNNGATLGFFEKRWNGPISINSPISFDVNYSNISSPEPVSGENTPGNKRYMRFNTTASSWRTKTGILPSAVKTITLMIKPDAQTDKYSLVMFHAAAGQLFIERGDNGIYKFIASSYINGGITGRCVIGEWNFIVIQYIDSGKMMSYVTMHCETYSNLTTNKNRRADFLKQLTDSRSSFVKNGSSSTFEKEKETLTDWQIKDMLFKNQDKVGNVGLFSIIIGGSDILQRTHLGGIKPFTGDILWLHGFRQHFTSDFELDSEVNQLWASRWPTSPATDPYIPRTQTVGGNNGSVSCETYCRGISGGPWNGELPKEWNGAKCKSATDPKYNCQSVPGMVNGPNCAGTKTNPISPARCPTNCVCEETRTGWYPDNPFGFQSPSLSPELSDQRSNTSIAEQPPTSVASSIFNLFKW
jgi:hypothetical protein